MNVSRHRVFISRFGNWLIRKAFLPNVTMNTGMTRAYRRTVIQPLVTERNGKEFHLEVLLKLVGIGFKVHEIPAVITWPDSKTKSDINARKSSTKLLKTILSHLSFIVIARPLRLFFMLSILVLFLSLGSFLTWLCFQSRILNVSLHCLSWWNSRRVCSSIFQSRELLRRTWMSI